MTYYYRLAVLPQDAERIHQLNYRAFVEEIPQHASNEQRLLVDPFHEENTYIVCLKENEIVGMLALRSTRPFSLDKKIGPIEGWLEQKPQYPVEIRLLVVDRAHRSGRAFFGLMQGLVNWCKQAGYDAAVISGTVRELKLYRHMGFEPFANPVGTKEAKYVPMISSFAAYEKSAAKRLVAPVVNFLPGPPKIAENVKAAFASEAFSHRSAEYARLFTTVKRQLLDLTGAKYVQLLQGTGTLANDAVAAQLSRIGGRGLVVINGEFGQRLCDHSKRFGLAFDCLEQEWGEVLSLEKLAEQLDSQEYSWLWIVHCETSTGVLQELEQITALCRARAVRIAVDCASSVGTVPVNLRDVDFASSVSGKGLASYAGLGLVFHQEAIEPDETIPRYLDLGQYEKYDGIPYTQSSNAVVALHQSLENILLDPPQRFQRIRHCADRLREGVEKLGMEVVAPNEYANPGILTFVLPKGKSSKRLGDDLLLNGYRTHYESRYLQAHNWLQVATMNEPSDEEVERFLELLRCLLGVEEHASP
ncbi:MULTISPECIES: aminotransferase class V-fold PLP-dependent enzyme [unclassified Sporosarcina]|uniref:aminotransferase class V-fold PLP-dependent enzyme n=1 Tax=unclassified Sporosarcina TaxID=2647733 RepID=UPI000C167058|nr:MULTISPECIES: aminotransferase class V-fold PLP-dependent enzyme [unclassified Sporosarcina]PID04679.1 GNAT family N-acetyltransferase [Sporosarcina sp. P30]PID07786.1 GNAT family N-acetyltransferase [Sporosarcina sp. P31]PID11019.1 GNAT family N-acetyltransferase [Sporosarcina sp. P32b]